MSGVMTENEEIKEKNAPTDNNVEENEAPSEIEDRLHDEEMEIKFQDDLSNDGNLEDQTELDNFEDNALVDHQIMDTIQSEEEDYEFRKIQGHYWEDGILMFIVELTSGKTYDVPFSLIKKDRPIETAKHIKYEVVDNKRGGRYEQWAKKILVRAQRVIRRLHRHYNISRTLRLDTYKEIKMRKLSKNQQNKRKKNRAKFGIEVPNNVRHVLLLDRKNGNKA